jgi:hypothetical protein
VTQGRQNENLGRQNEVVDKQKSPKTSFKNKKVRRRNEIVSSRGCEGDGEQISERQKVGLPYSFFF